LTGEQVDLFFYSGRKVVTIPVWNAAFEVERKRVMKLKGVWAGGGGYEARYPEGGSEGHWQDHCAAAVNKKLCNIKDIIDHCIDELEKAYKGTVYEHISMLYHDGLTQWWTPESQAYIASRGWQYRQL
jgi:hypothetical protein